MRTRLTRRWWLLVAGVLFSMVLAGSAANAQGSWQITTVDNTVGEFSSLALDTQDYPHISYYDARNQDLKYAWWDGTTWHSETVDDDGFVGWYTSLALDTQDHPHISYYDRDNEDLKYAWWDGTTWQRTTVDSEGDVGSYASLALDTQGNPHISYLDGDNQVLKYAWWDGTTWQRTTADSDGAVGLFTSLALDTQGNPHISYLDGDNQDLKYAWWDGTTWHYSVADSEDGAYISLALDSSDRPHISYLDRVSQDLKYAWWDGTTWQHTTIDSDGIVGWYTSLALDSSGNPHISYADIHNNNVKYAWWNGTSWQYETVDHESDFSATGQYPSLALDRNGNPHISYGDSRSLETKYASLLVDTDAPTTTANASPYTFGDWTNQSVSVTLSANDGDGSGVADTYYTLNDGPQQTYATGTPISVTAEGTTMLDYWSTDLTGNAETHHTASIKIDQTDPTITYAGNQGNYTVDQTIDITCTATDQPNLSGIASTDCQDITAPATDFAVSSNTITNTATDNAGNVGTNSVTFTVGVTYDSLCRLSEQYAGDASILCAPLRLAELGQRTHNSLLEQSAINTYILLVNSQRGHGLTVSEAQTLVQLAQSLQ